MLTYEEDKVDLSIVMVKVKRGAEVPAHVHAQDDIVYHLEGKGKMWVSVLGFMSLGLKARQKSFGMELIV